MELAFYSRRSAIGIAIATIAAISTQVVLAESAVAEAEGHCERG
jgi:hypothetical protein